jgi:hypothetical protein
MGIKGRRGQGKGKMSMNFPVMHSSFKLGIGKPKTLDGKMNSGFRRNLLSDEASDYGSKRILCSAK